MRGAAGTGVLEQQMGGGMEGCCGLGAVVPSSCQLQPLLPSELTAVLPRCPAALAAGCRPSKVCGSPGAALRLQLPSTLLLQDSLGQLRPLNPAAEQAGSKGRSPRVSWRHLPPGKPPPAQAAPCHPARAAWGSSRLWPANHSPSTSHAGWSPSSVPSDASRSPRQKQPNPFLWGR